MAIGETARMLAELDLSDKFSGKLKNASGALGGFESRLGKVNRGVGQVAGGLGTLATRGALAAAGGLAAVVTTAASFEQAWAGVTKTVEGTDAQLADLQDQFKDLSRTVPLSFEELAAIGAEGGALGIATEDLIDFTDIVARLAVSTDLSADQASTALGQLGNILDLSADDMRDFGDSLVALGNDGASTESQIIDLAARFGAAGRSAGLSNEEILALASTTASMGIEAEAGGGALSRVFNNLTLDMANATDESKVLADAMGVSLGELKTRWESDAGGVFQELLGYISELDQFEAAQFLSDLGITNTRDINAIRNLSAGFEEYNRQLGVAEGQTNELNRESDAFFNTTQGKWQTLKNNVRLAADEIGSELLPVVNEMADEFVGWLSDPRTQTGIKDFARDLAGGIRGLIGELKGSDFSGIIDGMKLAAEVAKGAFDAFRALPAPVQQLAIAALVANKVSGGAVGQIARGLGNIGAGLFGRGARGGVGGLLGGRGSTPANPLFVTVVGPGGIGGGAPLGGAPAAAAAGGGLAGALALGGGILLPFAMFNLIPELFRGPEGAGRQTVERRNEQGETIVKLDAQTTAMFQGLMPSFISTVERNGGIVTAAINESSSLNDQSLSDLREETRSLHDPLGTISDINKRSALGIEETRDEVRDLQMQNKAAIAASDAKRAAQHSQAIERQNTAIARIDAMKMATDGVASSVRTTAGNTAAQLSRIESAERATAANTARTESTLARKNFNPTLNASINVNTTVSVDNVIRRVESHSVATDFRGGWSEL